MVLHGRDYIKSRSKNPDTFNRYATAWEKRVGPAFGHLLWSELTPDVVQNGLTIAGSGSTQQTDKIVLSHLTTLAIALGYADAKVAIFLRMARLTKREKKRRFGIAGKAEKLYAAAVQCGSWMAGPMYMMKTIGPRKGMVCALRPTDIDTVNGIITFNKQRNHTQGERTGLKGAIKELRIGVPVEMAVKIASFHREGTIYLFTRPDGRPLPYQHLDAEIKKICKLVPGTEPCTPHDFRAAAICNLIAAGASDQQIAEIFGHNSTEEIKHYRDESPDRTRATVSTVVPSG